MTRLPALLLLVAAPLAAGQELSFPKELYEVRPLEFAVSVPEGWEAQQDHTGMVAHDQARNGFLVSREPFLHDPKDFADVWASVLGAAGKETKVKATKAGRYQAWRAGWDEGGRTIDIWRIYVPDVEMLYNFSFSAARGTDLEPLRKGLFRSFKVKAPKPELKFSKQAENVTNTVTIRLPEDYQKSGGIQGFSLGGGLSGGYVKVLGGYKEPHVAGRIRWRQFDARVYYSDAGINGTDVKGLLEYMWKTSVDELGEVTKKPRTRASRYGGMKGYLTVAEVKSKQGVPRIWYGWCGKHKTDVVFVGLLVDEREVRLHKNLFKELCSTLKVRS